jgi:hypothetical protein
MTTYAGWMSLGGQELWNAERTRTYVAANLPSIELLGCQECTTLDDALGDAVYKNNPVDDNAPWVSADDPDLNLFYGFYPISIGGLTDSTNTVTVTESIGDGGSISAARRATKEIRISGVLIAGTDAALNKGKAWLRNITRGPDCGDGGCNGADICFFAVCPSSLSQGDYYLRTVRDVALLQGVTTTREFGPASGGCGSGTSAGYMEQVEFTFVAGTPHVYGQIDNLGSSMGTVPTTTGVMTLNETAPVLPNCLPVTVVPIYDPADAPTPPAPRPPPVTTALKPPLPWEAGYSLFIPKSHVPEATDAVLIAALTTGSEAARYVRLRLFPAPLGLTQTVRDLDPCSFCGEVIVTYIPPNSTFLVDGMNQTLTITDTAGNTRPASHLAYSGLGTPTSWAALTCGVDYWLAVEFPGKASPLNLFVTGAAKDSSTFNVDIGSWTNGVDDGSPRATLARDTAQFHGTPASMKVRWPMGSNDRPQVVLTGLTVGLTYELSAWIRSPLSSVRLDLGPTRNGVQSAISPSWQFLAINVVATSTTMMARLSTDNNIDSGDTWVDDFGLRDASSARNTIVRLNLSTARRM